MKHSLQIAASVDQPALLENMIEQLASRRYEIGYSYEQMPEGWQAIETSSAEIYVNGTVELLFSGKENIRMPFITCFLFTCAHSKDHTYKLNWSLSLS